MARVKVINRRDLVVRGSAAATLSLLITRWANEAMAQDAAAAAPASPAEAQPAAAAPAAPPAPWQIELRKILGEAKPVEGKIGFEVPETAENGNTVPYSVTVESPMTPENHVRAIHILSTANPLPMVASFKLSVDSGTATVSSRMRLIKSQDVICVVERSDGTFVLGRRPVKVTIGCCGA